MIDIPERLLEPPSEREMTAKDYERLMETEPFLFCDYADQLYEEMVEERLLEDD